MSGQCVPVIRVVERATGARILPTFGRDPDVRATVGAWQAHCACDADLRATRPVWRDLASRLEVRR